MNKPRIIIIAVTLVAVVVAVAFVGPSAKRKAESWQCANCLASLGCAARLWAGEHDGHFPSDLVTLSNEVSATKIMICPGDRSRQAAESWASFTPGQSSFDLVTPDLREGDTNRVFLKCKVHDSVLYADGSVFVHGRLHHKY